MTLLGHWKIGDARGTGMDGQTAIDSAAGGSGDHNGIYKLSTSYDAVLSVPGYDEGLHLNLSSGDYGYIHTFNNLADLRLTGTMTVMFWFKRPYNYGVIDGMHIAGMGANSELQADNYLWVYV